MWPSHSLASVCICHILPGGGVSRSCRPVINEVCSGNFTAVKDENGQYADYIELYNPGSEEISLEGCFLSDDKEQLRKYSLDPFVVPPKGYCVVWPGEAQAGADADALPGSGFRLSRAGEEIYLSCSDGEEITDSVAVPELSYNTSYGRTRDGGEDWKKMTTTAGTSNAAAQILPSVELNDPVFSVPGGFYEEAFSLTITAEEDEIVYYTLDGSDPTPEADLCQGSIRIDDAGMRENVYAARTDLSPTREYIPPFLVDKATVVRAVSCNLQENTVSRIVTEVYFVGYEQKEEYKNLPVMSIVSDPDNLFDMETGIYGNGARLEKYKADGGLKDGKLLDSFTDESGNGHYLYEASNAFMDGREWEREATVTFFDQDHQPVFTQNVGIRTAGQSSRAAPQKSFSIYGRDIYDRNAVFPYEFFPGTDYSSIKLRNGGSDYGKAMITDAFLEELAAERNVSIQRSGPCIVFLNGEYWGVYNIRERYKEEYLSSHYGVKEDNVWLIDAGDVRVGGEEAREAYQFMLDVLTECDLSYDDVYEMVCGIIDVQSLIDFCCINLYIDNRDISFVQNTALWRTAETEDEKFGDGLWRWMLFDLDISIHADSNSQPLSWMKENVLLNEPAVQSLMKNRQFRKQFCLTFMDIANTVYSYEKVHEKLTEWRERYSAQIVKSYRRFLNKDFTEAEYDGYIEAMDTFFRQRFSFAAESLAEEFGLTGSLETVTVENPFPEGGTVTVNTARTEEREWRGDYFTDYPVVLTAEAKEGYRFAGWSGDVSAKENRIEVSLPEGGVTVRATFEKAE